MFLSKLVRLLFRLLGLDQMELVHEPLQGFDNAWVCFYVKLCGELPYQTFLTIGRRTKHEPVRLDHAGLYKFLKCLFRH